MDDEEIPHFNSKEEETKYWKETAMQFRDRVEELEKELIDFQENSSQLEKELEKSLELADRANRDLRTKCNRLTLDLDMCRVSTFNFLCLFKFFLTTIFWFSGKIRTTVSSVQ